MHIKNDDYDVALSKKKIKSFCLGKYKNYLHCKYDVQLRQRVILCCYTELFCRGLMVVVLEAITKLIDLIGAYKRMIGLFGGTPHRAMTNVAKLVTA